MKQATTTITKITEVIYPSEPVYEIEEIKQGIITFKRVKNVQS